VIAAVREQNVQIAAGRAGSPPSPSGVQLELPLRTKGRLSTVEEFESDRDPRRAGGSLLQLGDVARVELGAPELRRIHAFGRINPSTTLGVFQLPERRTPSRCRRGVRAELERLSHSFRPAWRRWSRYDPTQFVAESISEVMHTLFIAMVLVFIVVYVFLQDWRATLIPAVHDPGLA